MSLPWDGRSLVVIEAVRRAEVPPSGGPLWRENHLTSSAAPRVQDRDRRASPFVRTPYTVNRKGMLRVLRVITGG